MTVKNMIVFVATMFTLTGIWKFIWIFIHQRGYKMFAQEGESFFDFLCRYYADEPFNRFKKGSKLRIVYNSKMYKIIMSLQGIILLLLGIGMFIFVFAAKSSEYGVWLNIKF